jgi:hypothetical protein
MAALAMGVTILSITTWAAPRILRKSRQHRLRRRKRFTGPKIGLCTKGSAAAPRNERRVGRTVHSVIVERVSDGGVRNRDASVKLGAAF